MKTDDSKLSGCLIDFILFVVAMEFSCATSSYYVSPKGNDRNYGTSPSFPWKTPNIINSRRFNPGDRILFERVGEWYGQLNVPGSDRLIVDIKIVIFALIIKHKLSLSDQDIVDICKRKESDKFYEFNKTAIRCAESLKAKAQQEQKELRLLLAIN